MKFKFQKREKKTESKSGPKKTRNSGCRWMQKSMLTSASYNVGSVVKQWDHRFPTIRGLELAEISP
jgi:hypothetical protein